MSASRESIAAALMTLLTNSYTWGSTPSRRVKPWSDVPESQRPVFFLSEGVAQTYSWTMQPLPKRTIGFKVYIYGDAKDPATIGAQTLNSILDAFDSALAPSPGTLKQTLGGLCDNCRIKSVPLIDAGDFDGDSVLIVYIEVIIP